MKKLLSVLILVILVFTVTACGSAKDNDATNDSKEIKTISESKTDTAPANLVGEWKQSNSNSKDSWQEATINDTTIEIYWVSDNGDTKSLYWAGSFVAPNTSKEPYSWESTNDHEKTDSAMLASSDDTKTIKYEKGVISYEASALGTTTTIKLEKK